MSGRPTLSVVMPAYNEEGAIEAATAEVREFVLDRIAGSELVVVNDGSRDRTGELLDRIAAGDRRIRVVHKANGGHGPALRTAIDAAQGEHLLFLDSDRQIPLDQVDPLWKAIGAGHDAAFGVRVQREDPTLRLWLTRIIRMALPMLFGVRIRDANVPFKLIKRCVWDDARRLIPEETLAPSLFLAVYAARRGFRIAYVSVTHRERQTGVVSIRRWKLIRFCWRAFLQLLTFRRQISTRAAGESLLSPS